MQFRQLLAGVTLIVLVNFCCDLQARVASSDLPAAQALRDRIAALSPSIRADEAQRVAESAYATSAQLRRDYGVIGGPPSFHNLLVQLDALKLRTLELHWAEARAGSWREHNCVVVTAKGQRFREGIILDCWRHSGHLFWSPLVTDHYPWIEDRNYATVVRSKFSATKRSRLADLRNTDLGSMRATGL